MPIMETLLLRRQNNPVGRPKKEGEILSEERAIKFAPSMMERLQGRSEDTGVTIAEIIRRAVAKDLEGSSPDDDDNPSYAYRAPFLTKAPAGPWREAIENSGHFLLSEQTADYLEAREGDVVVGVMGESMEGRRLFDGDLILMRPVSPHRQPVRGEIVLVQTWNEAGDYVSTIKEWRGMDGTHPRLVDGEGEDYPWPEDSVGWAAVAVAKGLIARL